MLETLEFNQANLECVQICRTRMLRPILLERYGSQLSKGAKYVARALKLPSESPFFRAFVANDGTPSVMLQRQSLSRTFGFQLLLRNAHLQKDLETHLCT